MSRCPKVYDFRTSALHRSRRRIRHTAQLLFQQLREAPDIVPDILSIVAPLHPFIRRIAVSARENKLAGAACAAAHHSLLLLHHQDIVEALLPRPRISDILEIPR